MFQIINITVDGDDVLSMFIDEVDTITLQVASADEAEQISFTIENKLD